MTCSSTVLEYPLAVLAQTPTAYILMYCNTFSTTLTAVRCFQLRKKVLRLDATSYQSSDRTVQHLCLWLQNEHEWQFCEEFAPHPGGTKDNDAHRCEPNYIKVQNKIIAKILPVNNFTTLKFLSLLRLMNGQFFSWLLYFALQYMFIQIGSQTWASLSFVPPFPGWGANSSRGCRSCSISGHKQRCWTFLSELQYKVAYNPNWKQCTAGIAVEHALQYIKMYVAGVWTKTAKGYLKMSRNKSFDVRARFGAICGASKTIKHLLKNSTIGNRLLFSE